MEIRAPKTDQEWEAYYNLRYKILRAPLNQPIGSERNDGDLTGQHFALFSEGGADEERGGYVAELGGGGDQRKHRREFAAVEFIATEPFLLQTKPSISLKA